MTAVGALMLAPRPALAGPTGGSVVAGSAAIQQSGTTTNINQSSNNAVINWQGFSIGSNETVNFNQPSASSATLNRVIGNETSVINGALNANGNVFIVNPSGVLFGKGAAVNVGGLVASTLDISNADFMAGRYTFSGSSTASVINRGHIHASPGGYVALLGKTVANDGVISANLGTVAMASGQQITLNFGGNSLVDVTIDKGALNALVSNKRAIIANGGQVIMTARAADEVLSAQVNNTGIIQARTMAALTGGGTGTRVVHKGSIKLLAQGGTVNVAGKLDASAPKGGDGGFIETSGNKVHVADSAVITTKSANGQDGTWLIDPDGFTIAATGGDITGATLASQLANGSVTILSTSGSGTDGNINVNDAVTWSSASNLTLTATNSININANGAMSWGTGTLTLNATNADINIAAPLTSPSGTMVWNAGGDVNINATNALNVATIRSPGFSGSLTNLNFNQAQTWATPPDLSLLFVNANINVYADLKWTSGTLTLGPFGDVNIGSASNPHGSLYGPTLDLVGGGQTFNFNINAPNALNVTTVTASFGDLFGDFNINAPQAWSAATTPTGRPPRLSGLPIDGNLNVNAPLTWSSGTLVLNPYGKLNINAALTGSTGTTLDLNGGSGVTITATNALNVPTIISSSGIYQNFNINASQSWTTPPDMSGMYILGNTNINAPVTWTNGTLVLNTFAPSNVNINIGGSFTGPTLDLGNPANFNINALNALNVGAVIGSFGGLTGNLNINLPQTWTTAPPPDLSGLAVAGNVNVNAALAWSTGTLTLIGANVNLNSAQNWSAPAILAATNNINVNAPVSWSAGTLTLNAGQNIFVNATMTASGTAGFAANYGYVLDANGNPTTTATAGNNADNTPYGIYVGVSSAGNYTGGINFVGTGTVNLNKKATTVINTAADLDAVATNLSGSYVLGRDIAGLSFGDLAPFGFSTTYVFTGNFNGFGHTLTTAAQPSFTLPSIGTLNGTNLVLNSKGDITIGANVTSGAGILTLNAAQGGNINLNASLQSVAGSFVLGGGGVTFNTSQSVSGTNIVINAPVKWSANTLTLNATSNIYVNNVMTADTTASFTGTYGSGTNPNGTPNGIYMAMGQTNGVNNGTFAGKLNFSGSGTLTLNGTAATVINTLDALASQATADPTKLYVLGSDLNHATTDPTSTYTFSGSVVNANLTGTLDGLGHTITGITINDITTNGSDGLVGSSAIGSTIRNIGLVNTTITSGGGNVGALIGLNRGAVVNTFASGGSITASGPWVGGLAGDNIGALIANSWASINVTGGGSVGGLVGRNVFSFIPPTVIVGQILNSYATGNINAYPNGAAARSNFGGLVGENQASIIRNSYATGDVLSPSRNNGTTILNNSEGTSDLANVGGLVGLNSGSGSFLIPATISYSWASGNVTAPGTQLGGLVGLNAEANIDHSYATGNVTGTGGVGTTYVGGLVGWNQTGSVPETGYITNSYAKGNVNAANSTDVGGIAGLNSGLILNSQYNGGTVRGGINVGGIAGANQGSAAAAGGLYSVSVASTATIIGVNFVGGVAGFNSTGNANYATVANGSSLATVIGNSNVGGGVGFNAGDISGGNFGGTVIGNTNVGGSVGFNAAPTSNQVGGQVHDTTSTASVTGNNNNTTNSDIGQNQNSDPNAVTNSTGSGPVSTPASRAQAAAQGAAVRAGLAQQAGSAATVTGADAKTSALTPPTSDISAAGTKAVEAAVSPAVDDNLKNIESNIKSEEQQERRRRRHLAATTGTPRHSGGHRGVNGTATIRTIDVDGQRFNLQNGTPKQDAPAQPPH